LNGSSDNLVSYTDLNTIWAWFVTLYNMHTHAVSGSTASATPNKIISPYTTLDSAIVDTIFVP
jgi:hypothetical protein